MKLRIEYVETGHEGLQHFRTKIVTMLPDEASYVLKTGDTRPDVKPELVMRITIESFDDYPANLIRKRNA